jgi:putative two-component system response regulator
MKSNLFPTDEQLSAAKILIIDDEQVHIRVLEWAMRQAKFSHFHSITESTRAQEELKRFRPDIVLMDLNMPELDGYGVLQQFHQVIGADEFLPVLILTGETTAETRSRALAAGAHDFLPKPLDFSEVTLRMRNLLQTRFLYQKVRELQSKLDGMVERV